MDDVPIGKNTAAYGAAGCYGLWGHFHEVWSTGVFESICASCDIGSRWHVYSDIAYWGCDSRPCGMFQSGMRAVQSIDNINGILIMAPITDGRMRLGAQRV